MQVTFDMLGESNAAVLRASELPIKQSPESKTKVLVK